MKVNTACTSGNKSESGQITAFVALALGLFLIGAIALAVDLANLYFNSQSAQTAADAACTAGAMDLLIDATNGVSNQGNFNGGSNPTPVDCNSTTPNTSATSPAPCAYAALNGFPSSISHSSGTLGDNVYITFPSASSYCSGSSCEFNFPSATPTVLMQVSVTNNVPTWFAGFLQGKTTQSVGAKALCGLIQSTSPIPILVLNPTISGALSMAGGGSIKSTGDIAIAGGPSKSIQVNSSSSTAVSTSGNPTIDLCAGGSSYCGSTMGVWGSNSTPGGFWNTVAKCSAVNTLCTATQTAPQFNSPSAPVADPLATTAAPSAMGFNGTVTSSTSANPAIGCYDTTGCDEYGPGNWTSSSGITIKGRTAIFDPGIYYIKNGLNADANSCLLPSFATGDGSGGVIFYFADNSSVSVVANSGGGGHGCPTTAYNGVAGSFNTQLGPAGTPLANGVQCTATSQIPKNLPTFLTGSVLLAPCRAPTVAALCSPNCSINPGTNGGGGFGDPLGTGDPYGEQRGVLFFQNRGQVLPKKNQPAWGGGGSMLLAGTMYFHECVTTGIDTGVGCDYTNAFTDLFSLKGNPSSSTYVLGDIITDELTLNGSAGLTMDLNPSAAYTQLKASLLQ